MKHVAQPPPPLPPPLPARPATLASRNVRAEDDRRALLRYIHELHGGAGCPTDADLDAVSVTSLLAALRSGSSYAAGNVLFAGWSRVGPAARSLPQTAEVRVSKADTNAPESYKSTSESQSEDDDASTADEASDQRRDVTREPQQPLALAAVDDLGEDVSNAAYVLFTAAELLSRRSPPLNQFVRAQLGVSPAFAEHLARTLSSSGLSAADALTLRVPAYLLTAAAGVLGPKDVRRWQQTQGCIIAAALPPALQHALRARVLVAEPTAVAQACAYLDSSSWEIPSHARVLLYQSLVCCQWDDLDDSSGDLVDEAPQYLMTLKSLWRGLGVTERAHAAHCTFSALQRWLSSGAIQALRIARREIEDVATACKHDGTVAEVAQPERAHLLATLTPVAVRTVSMLSDLHQHFGRHDVESMESLLSVAQHTGAVIGVLLPDSNVPPFSAESCIVASVDAEYRRCVAELCSDPSSLKSGQLVAVAERCASFVDILTDKYATILERVEPRAVCIAVTHLQSLYETQLRGWLSSSHDITDTVTALKGAANLVAKMQTAAISGKDGDPPTPIDCAAIGEARVKVFVDSRVAELHTWAQRSLSTETWALDPSSRNRGAPSAVELVRAVNEATEAFFRLKMHQTAPVTSLTRGVASVVTCYTSTVLRSIGDPDELLPPRPQLTRYKKAALDMLVQEHAKAPAAGPAKHPPTVPRPDVDQLLLMFNTMCFLLDEVRVLDQGIQRQWASLEQQVNTLRRVVDGVTLAGLFVEARRTCTEAKERAVARLAGTVIFHQLRDAFIDGAYMFGTSSKAVRLATALLDPLNEWMTKACNSVAEAERNTVAAAMLASTARGISFVLLNGGPCRVFTEDDAPALRADLAEVYAFFQADGEGLPQHEVEALLGPVERIVEAMALNSYSLLAAYDAAQPPIPQASMLHVICHRGDRIASKWLKKRMQTPKPLGFFAEKLQLLQNMRLHKDDSP